MRKLFVCLALAILIAGARSAEAAVKILVLPLDNLSKAASLQWLSEGLALEFSEQLPVPGLDVVGRSQAAPMVEALDLPPNAPLSRASMIRVAQGCAADYLITGSYSGSADKLQVSVRILDMKSMKLGPGIMASGPLAALPQMENQIAWDVLSRLGMSGTIARDQLAKRTRIIPNEAFSLYIRSFSVPDEDEKAKMLERAVEAYENFPDAQYPLGRYYFQEEDCAKTLRALSIAGTRQQFHLHSEFMMGTCYLKQDAISDAIQAYSRLLSLVRSHEVFNNLAVAYLRKGDYPQAIQNLLDARNLSPDNLTIELNLALSRHLDGNHTAAREILEQSIKTHPNNGMLRYLLSLVLSDLLDVRGAEATLQQAKNLGADPQKLQSQELKSWARIFSSWQP